MKSIELPPEFARYAGNEEPSRKGAPHWKAGIPIASKTRPERSQGDLVRLADLDRLGASLTWTWNGWILESSLCLIAAEGGTGKTRFTADLARRIANGEPWPDGQEMKLPQDTGVLWIAADHQFAELSQLHKDFGLGDNVFLNSYKDNPLGGTSVDSLEELGELAERIDLTGAKLLIVDTLGNCTDRDLCSQHEAKGLAVPLMRLAADKKVAILLLYHTNKEGKPLGRRMVERCRTCILLERVEGAESGTFKLRVDKSFALMPPPLQGTMHRDRIEYGEAQATTAAVGRPDNETQNAMEWIVAKLKETRTRWQVSGLQKEAEKAGISERTFYRARKALLEAGKIRQEQEGEGNRSRKFLSLPLGTDEKEEESPF